MIETVTDHPNFITHQKSGEKADAKLANRCPHLCDGAWIFLLNRTRSPGTSTEIQELASEFSFCHSHALVVNVKPNVSVRAAPFFFYDKSNLTPVVRSFFYCPSQSNRIGGVLQQFSDSRERLRPIEIFTTQGLC